MGIQDIQTNPVFGAVDSDAVADGQPYGGQVLRYGSEVSNRIISKGQHCFTVAFNSDPTFTDTSLQGQTESWLVPSWEPVYHWSFRKPGGYNLASFRWWMRVDNQETSATDTVVQYAIQTSRAGFNPATSQTSDANRIQVVHPAATAAVEVGLDGVQISPDEVEAATLWMRGSPTATLGNTATYGSPSGGTVDRIISGGGRRSNLGNLVNASQLIDASATWNSSSVAASNAWDKGGHFVEFIDGSGRSLSGPRIIVYVPGPTPGTGGGWGTSNVLDFAPGVDQFTARQWEGLTYSIRRLNRWRLLSISGWVSERFV